MSLITRCMHSSGDTRLAWLAIMTAAAAAVSFSEKILPIPLPWVKPGLANIFTLLYVMNSRYRDGFTVAVLRTFVTAALSGGIFSVGHFFSLSGAIVSAVAMILIHRFGKRFFSLYGISVCGAYLHSVAQLACGIVLFFSWNAVMHIAPFILLLSLLSGSVTAWLTVRILSGTEVTDG